MLKELIDLMFKNGDADRILINAEQKRAFYYKGDDYPGYEMFYKAELLQALHYILFNTYVQFVGKKFLQTKDIPMGGNASPFIADLCLAWVEYKFMKDLSNSKVPSDFKLAKTLSNNCRYIDDISVINYLSFGKLAKHIDSSGRLKPCLCSYPDDLSVCLLYIVIALYYFIFYPKNYLSESPHLGIIIIICRCSSADW